MAEKGIREIQVADSIMQINGTGCLDMKPFWHNNRSLSHTVREVYIDGFHSVGRDSFALLPSLNRVVLGPSVQNIMAGAFFRCEQLESVEFQTEKLLTIDGAAFARCSRLRYLLGTPHCQYVAPSAFQGTMFVLDQFEHSSIAAFGGVVFCAKPDAIEILKSHYPADAYKITPFAFQAHPCLSYLEIPDSITQIGDNIFFDIPRYVRVQTPNSTLLASTTAFSNRAIFV